MDPDEIPKDLKKEGPDWLAIFNPKVKRTLDVNLVHTFLHESVVCCVRFSADGKYLATGCNKSAQIFDTKTGAKTCVLTDQNANSKGDLYIRSVCFSPDGKCLATGAEDRQIRIWDIKSKKVKHLFSDTSRRFTRWTTPRMVGSSLLDREIRRLGFGMWRTVSCCIRFTLRLVSNMVLAKLVLHPSVSRAITAWWQQEPSTRWYAYGTLKRASN